MIFAITLMLGQIVHTNDIGVLPTNTSTVNSANLQAAYDKLGSGKIIFDAGTIRLNSDLMADSPISLVGEGKGISNVIVEGGHNFATMGIRRTLRPQYTTPGKPPTLTKDHFIDLTSVGFPGKWGFQTQAYTTIAQQGGPWDLGRGDGYLSARSLTISLWLDFSQTDMTVEQMSIWGMSIHGQPSPVALMLVRGQLLLALTTIPQGDLLNPITTACWLGRPQKGLCKVRVQVDLPTGKILNWLDDTQAGVTYQSAVLLPGRQFYPNRFAPCSFASVGENPTKDHDFTGGTINLGILGAHISDQSLFIDSGVGGPITRADGKPVTNSMFFDMGLPGSIASLTLADTPDLVISTRQVATKPSGTAFYLDYAHKNNYNTVAPGIVKDLSIQLLDQKYGSGMNLGLAYGFTIRDCEISGGARSISAYNLGANWPNIVMDCKLGGSDCAIYQYYVAQSTIERCSLTSVYRDGIRLNRVGNAQLKTIFSSHYEMPSTFVYARMSCIKTSNTNLDNETKNKGSQLCDFYITTMDSGGPAISTINDHVNAVAGPNASTIILDGRAVGVQGKATITGIQLQNPSLQRSMLRVLGTNFVYDAEHPLAPLPIPWIDGNTTN